MRTNGVLDITTSMRPVLHFISHFSSLFLSNCISVFFFLIAFFIRFSIHVRFVHWNVNAHDEQASDWEAVYAILERARNEYQSRGGPVGWWWRVRRKATNNAVAPLQGITAMASKMAPDDPFSTPVLGAVGMLLDVSAIISQKRYLYAG